MALNADFRERRLLALALAVLHHGMSCLSPNSIPSKSSTVQDTADGFYDYLGKSNVPSRETDRTGKG